MSEAESVLGGRLPLLDPERLDEPGRALVAALDATWVPQADATPFRSKTEDGRFIGPFNPFLYAPTTSAAYIAFQMTEAKQSSLDERLRQTVILSVGAVWQSAYEIYAHKAAARKAGLSPEEADRLASGDLCPSLRPKEQLAQRIALRLARDHRLDADLYREGRASFGETGLVDIVMLVGNYLFICALLNAFEIPAPASG